MAITNRRLSRSRLHKIKYSKSTATATALSTAASTRRKKATATSSGSSSRRSKSPPYKIPRTLKKAIKRNLIKIVKDRRRKIKDEEHKKTLIDIEARTFESRGYFQAFDHILQNFDMSDDLAHMLDELLHRCICNTKAGVGRQEAGLIGKKPFANKVLEGGYLTEEIKKDMLEWKGEKEVLEQEVEVEIEVVEEIRSGSGTTEE